MRDHVVAGAQQREQHGVDRAHARGGGQRACSALQFGDRVLQGPDGGVAQPAVRERGAGPGEGRGQVVRVVEGEHVALVDRHAERATAGDVGDGRVDGLALGVPRPGG